MSLPNPLRSHRHGAAIPREGPCIANAETWGMLKEQHKLWTGPKATLYLWLLFAKLPRKQILWLADWWLLKQKPKAFFGINIALLSAPKERPSFNRCNSQRYLVSSSHQNIGFLLGYLFFVSQINACYLSHWPLILRLTTRHGISWRKVKYDFTLEPKNKTKHKRKKKKTLTGTVDWWLPGAER